MKLKTVKLKNCQFDKKNNKIKQFKGIFSLSQNKFDNYFKNDYFRTNNTVNSVEC